MSWKDDIKNSIMALAKTAELKDKPNIYYAKVDTDNPYNVATRTCSCTLLGGKSDINLTSVSLMAEINDGLLVLPSPGSTIIVAKAPNSDPYVVMFSQVDQILYIAGDAQFMMKDGTVTIQQGDNSIISMTGGDNVTIQQASNLMFSLTGGDTATLQQGDLKITLNGNMMNMQNTSSGKNFTTIMNNILTHIMDMIVDTGVGPASLDPSTVTNLNSDLSDINAILN